ncbi:aldo-keto reductase family 1 member B1-like [Microplitis mediator]|uniref:aldo-keto reductase family 1 member B1-like n=1 Tax=Microplitis mediator TaxID=375433 RepID=UPI0025550664|nr:aldo-keto reductase family 1 member B1-like [Microplitis mediator]
MSQVPTIALNNGNKIPVIGLGTWRAATGVVTQIVKDAIDVGYRHFDCALVYQNEKEIGEALRAKINEGVVKREDLFITSKLWNTYHKTESVEKGIRRSLTNLGLDYLDLYLIHWPMAYIDTDELFPVNPDGTPAATDTDYLDTWKGMEGVLEKGLAKNIGISNFNSEQITRLLANCKVKPVVNQVECHPYLTQKKLSAFCKEREIVITAYGPMGSRDRPWAKPEDPVLLEDKKLCDIANKYKKTPAQIVIRYQIDRGHVVIPKTSTSSRLTENFSVFDFKLSDEDVAYIDRFDVGGRLVALKDRAHCPNYPFDIPF